MWQYLPGSSPILLVEPKSCEPSAPLHQWSLRTNYTSVSVNSIQLSPEGEGKSIQLSPEGRWIVVMDIPRREASRDLSSAIYLALWTNPEGDNCFSIYQISCRKIKKELFVKKDVTLIQFVFVSIDSVSGIIFYDFVANWQQAKFCHFLGICWRSCFIYRYNFIFGNCRETRSYFESCPKTVNIQGYSELREPIRTRENFYPLPDLVKTKTFDFSNKVFIFKIYLLIS